MCGYAKGSCLGGWKHVKLGMKSNYVYSHRVEAIVTDLEFLALPEIRYWWSECMNEFVDVDFLKLKDSFCGNKFIRLNLKECNFFDGRNLKSFDLFPSKVISHGIMSFLLDFPQNFSDVSSYSSFELRNIISIKTSKCHKFLQRISDIILPEKPFSNSKLRKPFQTPHQQ